ncbi:MAG: AAA family ATPase [Gammaproteobacteria bacterium]
MTMVSVQSETVPADTEFVSRLATLAPRPRTMADTGLGRNILEELLAKHLYDAGVLDLQALVGRTALAGPVLEEILALLRANQYVEVRGKSELSVGLRYALTDRGRALALEALGRNGYIGPAPISINQYAALIQAQSVHAHEITREQMHQAFSDIVLRDSLLDELGPAVHSGRPIFVYGPPGTGKTYIGQRLARLLGAPVLIPHAIAVDESTVQIFDPIVHEPIDSSSGPSLMLQHGFDPRLVLCQRPAIVTGGELTLDMLEVRYSRETRVHHAPLQLKATNGIYLIDDLGRQRVEPVDLFNRWIVPLENRQDFLSLGSGKRFPVPFDVVLVFSTNLNPIDLADDAFLRRIGHKIHFGPISPQDYGAIWQQVCAERGIAFEASLLEFALRELHGRHRVALLPCHPRDLIGMALDQARYEGGAENITAHMLATAWKNYFVDLNVDPDACAVPSARADNT